MRPVLVVTLALLSLPAGAQDKPSANDAIVRANRDRLYTRESEVESVRSQRDKYEYYRLQRLKKEQECRDDPASPVCKELETCLGPGCGSAGR